MGKRKFTKRDSDLDAILEVLMFTIVPEFKELTKKTYGSDKFTKETLKDALTKLELEDWVFYKYLDKLENDGFIETDNNGFISITNNGENLMINDRGYRGIADKKSKEKERESIKDWILKFDKRWRMPAAFITIIAIILSILKCNNS